MNFLSKLTKPPWRTVVLGALILLAVGGTYLLWKPGLRVVDGSNDRGQNAVWISHGWLGDDDWFSRNDRNAQLSYYRDDKSIRDLAALLRRHHITDVFPHLCPADLNGALPAVDVEQVERFLDDLPGFRVLPWVGGPNGGNVRLKDSKWRTVFVTAVSGLLNAHPRLSGVHLNVEPLPSGDVGFLTLLEEMKVAMPEGRILSVAAYPPPTRWHPFPDVHWDQAYYTEVAARCDQLVAMMYDTAIRKPKIYQYVMAEWAEEVIAWSGDTDVLLGLPTYSDEGVDYHLPAVENLRNALLGVHRGLSKLETAENYQGVALYCEWETDETEWELFNEWFVKK